MLFLFSLTLFFFMAGLVCPPLMFVAAFFGYLAYSKTRHGVRAIRRAEDARAAKLATRSHRDAIRFFS